MTVFPANFLTHAKHSAFSTNHLTDIDKINFTELRLRVHSHWYEYESGQPYASSSKHEIACIPVVAVHIDTSSVRVRVTCEFHLYEQFLYRPCFYPTRTM